MHGANWNGAGRNLYMVGKWLDGNHNGAADAGEEARVDTNATDETVGITAADNAVVFTSRTGADSFDENDGPYSAAADTDDICATCHAAATGGAAGTGGGSHDGLAGPFEMRGQDCTPCHAHDFGFMPAGCNACHGDGSTTSGQYWPDGVDNNPSRVLYADDNPGAHENHVAAISRQVFGLATTALLLADPASGTKQVQICRYCHRNPGGSVAGVGHSTDSGDQRADVYGATGTGDYFGRYQVGAEPLPPAAPVEDDTGLAYIYGAVTEGTCSNLVCHNQRATPFWSTPPVTPADWATLMAGNPTCSSIPCHAPASYTLAHAAHVGGSPKSFDCTECHADNHDETDADTIAASLRHANGEVDMHFNNSLAFALEAVAPRVVANRGNGFYDKDNSAGVVPTAGDTAFAYKSGDIPVADPTQYARSCYLVYCHGGDNDANVATSIPDWGGSTTSPSPVWNTVAVPLACTTCHADQQTLATSTARHNVHVTNNAWVPDACGSCHRRRRRSRRPRRPTTN